MVGRASAISHLLQLPRRLARRVRQASRKLRPGPVILMYHRVTEESFDPWGLAVSPASFAEQMAWLAANCTVLPLVEFAELHRRRALPPRAVALTFDDGYHCNVAVAGPLMKAHGLPATLFICPTLLERGEECWWDDLQRIVLSAPGESLTLRTEAREHVVELGPRTEGDWTWPADQPSRTERQHAFIELWSRLRVLEPEAQHRALADLRQQAGVPAAPRASHRLMTAGDIAAAQRTGFTIGAHTLTHVALSEHGAGLQSQEIEGSRAGCLDLTGTSPACFAYPYGDLDDTSARIVEEAGFRCACTTESARVRSEDSLFRLPRVRVGDWSGPELARALRAA